MINITYNIQTGETTFYEVADIDIDTPIESTTQEKTIEERITELQTAIEILLNGVTE